MFLKLSSAFAVSLVPPPVNRHLSYDWVEGATIGREELQLGGRGARRGQRSMLWK